MLDSYDAAYPTSDSYSFVAELIRQAEKRRLIATSCPGFVEEGRGFVMPTKQFGRAKKRYTWDETTSSDFFDQRAGCLANYQKYVLKPALHSPVATLAVLLPLASSLLSYTRERSKIQLIPETGIFHIVGPTTCGKTTCARICASVFGSPDAIFDWEITLPAVPEAAYTRNSLVLVLDDMENSGLSEAELLNKAAAIGTRVPAGASKSLTIAVQRGGRPQLTYSCFGLSSGPECMADLAKRAGKRRNGQDVRFIEFMCPSSEKGGVFGFSVRGTQEKILDSKSLADGISDAIRSNHGVLFPAWIDALLQLEDPKKVRRDISRFVEKVARYSIPKDRRVAEKFGLLYAAGRLGIANGLLPWPKDWPLRSLRCLYREAARARDPESYNLDAALRNLSRKARRRRAFPDIKMVGCDGKLPGDAVGVRKRHRRQAIHLIDLEHAAALIQPSVDPGALRSKMHALKLLLVSGNATRSHQIRIGNSATSSKVRMWAVDRAALREFSRNKKGRSFK
ncbi:DUF927 domain-containing protein [Methylobacterium sp. CM6244]